MAGVKHLNGDTEQFGYVFPAGKVVEVTDPVHLRKFRGNPAFEVEGDDPAVAASAGEAVDPAYVRDENGDTPEMAEMRAKFDRAFADVSGKLEAAEMERDAALAELAKLKAPATLKAEHHGGGKFNITNGETVLAKGLSKGDADAFNAMTDAEKAEYVKAEQAKQQ